jgi:hypothetical protein
MLDRDSEISCGRATSYNILKKLYDLIKRSKAGDKLLVYFTGRGEGLHFYGVALATPKEKEVLNN